MFPFIVNNSMYMCQIIVDKSMYVNVPIDCQLICIHKYNVSIYCQQIYVHKCVDLFSTNLCTCDDLLFAIQFDLQLTEEQMEALIAD